jgi:hypothetical protein
MPSPKAARIIKKSGEQGFSYLNKTKRDELEREKRSEQAKIKEAQYYKTEVDGRLVNRRVRSIDNLLNEFSPPETDGQTKDDLIKEEKRLRDEIRQGMLPVEVMERNPPNAAWANIKFAEANKRKILKWKNLRKVIHREDENPDLCNFEAYRPSLNPQGTTTFMANAQLPGHMALSEDAKENFPESMGQDVNSALNQVLEAEDEIDTEAEDEALGYDKEKVDQMLEDFKKVEEK